MKLMTTNKPKDDLDAVREVVESIKSFSEEEQIRIIKWSCEKLGISMSNNYPQKEEKMPTNLIVETPVSDPAHFSKPKDIKSFVEGKNPRSDRHFAAVVAYYYQFESEEKKDSITKSDLVTATRLANWDRLPRPDQTLVNAANAGLLDKVAWGHYSLNSVGENLVAMVLPNSEDTKSRVPRKNRNKNQSKNKKPRKK